MNRLYDGTCQADELGVADCSCRVCTMTRFIAVDEFISAEKLRMSFCPRLPRDDLDESGNVYVRLTEEHTEVRCA